jgi:molecular chaperone GrpE
MQAEQQQQDPLELLQRERANFLNFKRRAERERVEERRRGQEETVRALLPVIDDLDRALAQVPDELIDHPWAQGIVLARQQLLEALKRLGVERIGEAGELFDPTLHEAVEYDNPSHEAEPRVVRVLRPGYRMDARLLRPAQVAVGTQHNNGRHTDHA